MPIRILPDEVAAGIAAGEVVERPASVVRELLDNALDAGAQRITVELRRGGLDLLRVSDDGCGIPEDEVELAFARHATSKLHGLEDLPRLTSRGFRGEALPSIAAAARVVMVTRQAGSDAATRVVLERGVVRERSPASGAPGTTVAVESLFAEIPARRKFLRSTAAETTRVRKVVEVSVLANPGARISLVSDGRTLVQAPGNGSLRDAAAAIQAPDTAAQLLEVSAPASAPYAVEGLVGPPSLARANRSGMDFFVNGRWVQHRGLVAAVEQAYQGLLMQGHYPVGTLFLQVPPGEVDVNVHPAKREVRLARETDAFSSVVRAVRETLLRHASVPDAGMLTGGRPLSTPVAPSPAFILDGSGVARGTAAPIPPAAAYSPMLPGPLRLLGQIAHTYLVAEGDGGLYLVDQHAAHERVLFDRLLRQRRTGAREIQPLLEPRVVALTPEQSEALERELPQLGTMGFDAEPFGDGTWLLRAVPAMALKLSLPVLLDELIAERRSPSLGASAAHYAVAASVACHSAIRAGQALTMIEQQALLDQLESEAELAHCPHGRPTTIRVSLRTLEREFGRV